VDREVRIVAVIALAAAWLACSANAGDLHAGDEAARGKAIYRSAYRLDGTPVRATVQRDVPLPAGSGACATCHRRSGIGTAEGGARSLNLTARVLFAPTDKPPLRPAYDEAKLAAALIGGVAADGSRLSDLMPRYQLGKDDIRALYTYLHTLGAEDSPGVTADDIEVVTIVAEDAPPAARRAVLDTLERFIEQKNAGTRREVDRAVAANKNYFGHSRDRAYRRWDYHVWTLTGPASGWNEQLGSLYEQNPPFAVLSGFVGHDRGVVHDFCERRELPCLLPFDDAPAGTSGDFYSLYFSTGPDLQAQVAAADAAAEHGSSAGVLLVYADTPAARRGRDAFVAEWRKRGKSMPSEQTIRAEARPSPREWSRLLAGAQPDVLVTWIGEPQLATLATPGFRGLPPRIYTAEAFTDWSGDSVSEPFRARLRHVYPYALPRANGAQFVREEMWLKQRGLEDRERLPAAEAMFAAHTFGGALAEMQSVFSRDYLLETLEHSLDNTQTTSIYPTTTIGPGQRTISRGAWVTELGASQDGARFAKAHWLEP
jgi:hypothetical protein